MTAKEYLRNIRDEQRELQRLNKKMDSMLLNSALPSGIRYDKIKVQTSPKDPMEIFVRLSGLHEEIDRHIKKLKRNKQRAMRLIRKMDWSPNSSKYRQVLTLYYLTLGDDKKPLSWLDVAEEMGYSEDWIKHLHGEALLEFARLYVDKDSKKK